MKAKWIGNWSSIRDKRIIRMCYECFECKASCMKIQYASRPAPKLCLRKGNFIDWSNPRFRKLLKKIEAEKQGGLDEQKN